MGGRYLRFGRSMSAGQVHGRTMTGAGAGNRHAGTPGRATGPVDLRGRTPASHARQLRVLSRPQRIGRAIAGTVVAVGATVALYASAQSPHIGIWVTSDPATDSPQRVDVRFDGGTLGGAAEQVYVEIDREGTGQRLALDDANGVCGPSGKDRATVPVGHPDQSVFGPCRLIVPIPSKDHGRPFLATVHVRINGRDQPVENSTVTIGARTVG